MSVGERIREVRILPSTVMNVRAESGQTCRRTGFATRSTLYTRTSRAQGSIGRVFNIKE